MISPIDARYQHAQNLLNTAELIHDAATCQAAIEHMAQAICQDFDQKYPLILSVMGGAVVFTGRLLPLLHFPLDFDYIHISRYGNKLKGGSFEWRREPQNVAQRDVLVLDDILDEGHTMHAIVEHIMDLGATSCRTAVFANKLIAQTKPISVDYIGLDVPDRYVFGYGMDAQNMWRNLDAIYALAEH